jgi:hypothetical protein
MSTTKQQNVLKKLKAIYWRALDNKKWYAASHVLALQGKSTGLFDKRRFPEVKRISEMSERELHDFVAVLKKHDPDLAKAEQQQQQKDMGYPEKPPLIPKHPPPCVCPECLSYE